MDQLFASRRESIFTVHISICLLFLYSTYWWEYHEEICHNYQIAISVMSRSYTREFDVRVTFTPAWSTCPSLSGTLKAFGYLLMFTYVINYTINFVDGGDRRECGSVWPFLDRCWHLIIWSLLLTTAPITLKEMSLVQDIFKEWVSCKTWSFVFQQIACQYLWVSALLVDSEFLCWIVWFLTTLCFKYSLDKSPWKVIGQIAVVSVFIPNVFVIFRAKYIHHGAVRSSSHVWDIWWL